MIFQIIRRLGIYRKNTLRVERKSINNLVKLNNLPALSGLLIIALSGCYKAPSTSGIEERQADLIRTIARQEIVTDEQGGNWLSYGRTYNEQRFSPLTQINSDNVFRLGLAWYLDIPNTNSLEATPLVVDGSMYFTTGLSKVYAVNAATGKVIWEFDPEITKNGGRHLIWWKTNRGVAYWKGLVFVGTLDGRLIALNAETGNIVWSKQITDPSEVRPITGAPRVFNNKVIIGHAGSDMGTIRPFVAAYNINNGEEVWRFYIVPGNPADGFENDAMQMAARTWTGEWWKWGGGGSVWNAITYDPELNRIYFGTGNGSPWNRKIRSPGGGDNLFLCSIVAVDADTGEYIWHYQTNPGESWDWNSAMDIVLADLKIGGINRKVIMHAPKNGFFYVIDRQTGKLISAEKFAKVTWAKYVNLKTGRPVENVNIRFENGPVLLWPGPVGAHNWNPMSYNPGTGLVYIPYMNLPGYYSDETIDPKTFQLDNPWIVADGLDASAETYQDGDDTGGGLVAWDPVNQKAVWKVEHEYPWNGGTLTTAGNLVFQGTAAGKIKAFRADNGEELWSYYAGLGIDAPPISYELDGKQYVAVLVGWGAAGAAMGGPLFSKSGWQYGAHPRRLLTFVMDGKATAEPMPERITSVIPYDDPEIEIDKTLAQEGIKTFYGYCLWCHGTGAIASGMAPDLRASLIASNLDSFGEVLKQGTLTQRGMPKFDFLTDLQIKRIYMFLRWRARSDLY